MTTASPPAPRYDDVVDLNRYPVNDPDSSAYRALIQVCRDQLRQTGVAQLPGFLAPAAIAEMARVLRPGGELRGTSVVRQAGVRQDASCA